MIPTRKIAGVLLCFFISGAAGLIYQVAWVKALALTFGHTAYAVATVLAVFMGGLAAGSAYLARWGERSDSPVALYARIEFLIGLTGAFSLLGLHGVHSLSLAAYPALSNWPPLLFGLRLLGAILVLFIPTFLMGGTLPILISGLAEGHRELTLRVSQLYWINTAGAVFGALLAGFVLLPVFGLRLTIGAAAALNICAGFVAFGIAKGDATITRARSTLPDGRGSVNIYLLWLLGFVGATAMAYEIGWTRLLATTIGSSTYAFTLMLAMFLTGIAVGSALVQRSRLRLSLEALAWVQAGLGFAALTSLILIRSIPAVIPQILEATDRTFGGLILAQGITAALTVLPTAVVFGFNFPMAIALLDPEGRHESASSVVGLGYAANTIGAIVGSIATGFLLIPWLGSFRVIAAAAVLNLLLALVIHLSLPRRRLMPIAINALLILCAVFVASSSFFYDRALLSLSAVLYGSSYQGKLSLNEIAATKNLIFATEGVNDSIAVVRTDGDVALRINGKVDASTQDSRTQLLLGHLGAAFHNSPKRVLVIGFGSGMTASAVARYSDVQTIDCIEIEPAVLRAAPYLQSLNRGVLKDPRLHIIFDDARNFLLTSREKYDLIISEPSNPWIAGIATLFTDEYFAAARERLAPGGMFVQWVQAYSLAPADLRIIVATFAPHFREVTLWRGGETDLLLLGRTDDSNFKFDRLRSFWSKAALVDDFAALDVHLPEGLVAYFVLDDAAVRRLASGSVLNTDDRTLLEYDAPRSLLTSNSIDTDQKLIASFRGGPLPSSIEPSSVPSALTAGLATALDLNDATSAKALVELAGNDVAKGRLALMDGDNQRAKEFLGAAVKLEPESVEANYWLANAERRNGDEAPAAARIDKILALRPGFLPALAQKMELAAAREDFQTALAAQLKRIDLMREPPAYEYGRLGALWIKTQDFGQAEATLRKGLAKDPYCYACHVALGELYLRTGRLPLARENFEWVVRFFPDADAAAFRSLVGIDLLLKDIGAAKAALNKGLRLFPGDAGLLRARGELGG